MGSLEQVLRDRYGEAIVETCPLGFLSFVWNSRVESRRCNLYKPVDISIAEQAAPAPLAPIYGDAVGGSLLRGAIQIALLVGPKVSNIYTRAELEAQPEIARAKKMNPSIVYFMTAANVWYYGMWEDDLYCYDAECEELDGIGPFVGAMHQLLDDWEQADRSVR